MEPVILVPGMLYTDTVDARYFQVLCGGLLRAKDTPSNLGRGGCQVLVRLG